MRKLRSILTRSTLALAVAFMGMALMPSEAQAEVVVFTVDEGAVPGTAGNEFEADGITGKYREVLILDEVNGTFTATLVVEFTSYTLGGVSIDDQIGPTGTSGLGDPTAEEYGFYALSTISGNYSTQAGVVPGSTQFDFLVTAATADIYTDPLQNTVLDPSIPGATSGAGEDQHILTASLIDPLQSAGATVVAANGDVLFGGYAIFFTNPTLVNPDGPLYWPTLAALTLTATASGDVDPSSEGSVFPGDIRGDTSIAFQQQQVPEPASLALFGMGLFGAAVAARRRRRVA